MNAYTDGNNWIVKLPFVTNGTLTNCNTVSEVLACVECIRRKIYNGELAFVPYVMLQPKMTNNFEYKVVCWNGRPCYIAERKRGSCRGGAFAAKKEDKLLDFAASAVKMLSESCPHAILNGLVRVDIFTTQQEGKYVVNEFESLEARFYSTNGAKNGTIVAAMRCYWYEVLIAALSHIASGVKNG